MEREKILGKGSGKGMGKAKAEKIVGILFMSRTYAHMAHLKTDSYSQHIALNDFYDDESDADADIVEFADSLAEVAQGKWGRLDIPYIGLIGNVDKPVEALEEHLQMIMDEAEGCDDRALNAVIDQVCELYRKTIYLLSFTKA